jgi:hypothetical protein
MSQERRIWAALMLARDVSTCCSILRGVPVIAANLDAEVLRRALRGQALPPAPEFVQVDADMLEAIAEAGTLASVKPGAAGR